ncbi:MAG: FKBP-type peptidyl-prolyl cis-trans isomerase [Fibrobacterales bacterium]
MARGKTKPKGKGSQGQNRKNSDAYFEKMRNHADYQETPSGMLYSVIDMKEGICPEESDSVTVNQRISLVDGTIVADTYKDKPTTFPLSEAIEGYREGLLMMPEGSRFKCIIPPDLAWGKRGAGKKIGPNATLIIDVRLEEVIIQ